MITAHVESLTQRLDDLKPFFPAHWEELGIYRDRMPLAPQYGEYLRLDALGAALLVTLRKDGELVGYFVGFITQGFHYGETLQCKMDICYIQPQHRGGGGRVLFDAVRGELSRRGVKLWWVGSKDHHPIEGFYEAMGFTRQETHFTMWLGDDDARSA